ncbi:FxLYD domain-containing protein [Paenibacillus sp. J2TS4]|uniref:FxLYD domain-containing protein n=1 Tax=Paenibacillus sp. J2TS4 TaxID=2807194 RepID=UPI001B2B2C7F|nr:FxLYD domain-containing protein [Paenibacillus sp. J2TS4]GIP35734.1 hypothetical protein J2TS4_49440 [Paenibacillus sp. J2TS4]
MDFLSIFFTPWASIAIILTAVAVFSLLLGKYDRKTIVSSSIRAFLFLYLVIVFYNGVITYDNYAVDQHMNEILDKQYEVVQQQKSKLTSSDKYVVALSRENDNDDHINHIFVGNYSDKQLVSGELTLMLYNENGDSIMNKKIEVTDLKPGEKRKLDRIITEEKAEKYRYRWGKIK